MEAAARLRPQLLAQSVAAEGRYATPSHVFGRLVEQILPAQSAKIAWHLRIVEDGQLNAFSSPDGTIYVESGLAKLAGQSAGLWAAILSHEIEHVVRRDWARRYLYQKQLENGKGSPIVLGDTSLPGDSWMDSEKASADLGRFCRQLEMEADREGLMLMARAGYHPDFVPALHHLLHASGRFRANASIYAMHPCWEERDRELSRTYTQASIDFAHRWTEWYASPGGNPPVVVFAEEPKVEKGRSNEWLVRIPMRCQNLAGAVEVVLRSDPEHREGNRLESPSQLSDSDRELRQLSGCTSPRTTVTFELSDAGSSQAERWTDVYVLDALGSVLARADLPKSLR